MNLDEMENDIFEGKAIETKDVEEMVYSLKIARMFLLRLGKSKCDVGHDVSAFEVLKRMGI